MAKDTNQKKEHWSPPIIDGVETNKCRNACCENFGVPAYPSSKAKKASGVNEGYIRVGVGVGRRQNVGLKCQCCNDNAQQCRCRRRINTLSGSILDGRQHIANRFSGRGTWKIRLPQLLDMLVALGRAYENNGKYLNLK